MTIFKPHTHIIFNRELTERQNISIPPDDRAFRYGDGFFDTLRLCNGVLFQADFHVQRLQKSAATLDIPIDTDHILHDAGMLIQHAALHEGLIRISISRGAGGRGYLPVDTIAPMVIIEALPCPPAPPHPARLMISTIRKTPSACLPADIKHASNLNSVLARKQAAQAGYDEAVMLSTNGTISETSSGNIFWIKNTTLYTPSLACDCVEGSIRNLLKEYPQYAYQEAEAEPQLLASADAIFITNVAWPIWPVCSIAAITDNLNSNAVLPIMQWVKEMMQ